MKLEFYNKETGESCYWQNIWLADSKGSVFEELFENGVKLVYKPDIAFRITEENV